MGTEVVKAKCTVLAAADRLDNGARAAYSDQDRCIGANPTCFKHGYPAGQIRSRSGEGPQPPARRARSAIGVGPYSVGHRQSPMRRCKSSMRHRKPIVRRTKRKMRPSKSEVRPSNSDMRARKDRVRRRISGMKRRIEWMRRRKSKVRRFIQTVRGRISALRRLIESMHGRTQTMRVASEPWGAAKSAAQDATREHARASVCPTRQASMSNRLALLVEPASEELIAGPITGPRSRASVSHSRCLLADPSSRIGRVPSRTHSQRSCRRRSAGSWRTPT